MIEKYNKIFLLSSYLLLPYEEIVKMADFQKNQLIETLKQIIWQQEHME